MKQKMRTFRERFEESKREMRIGGDYYEDQWKCCLVVTFMMSVIETERERERITLDFLRLAIILTFVFLGLVKRSN